jgi:RNA methyltransferase, TrmH family
VQRITSRQNPRLREAVRLLASARDRRKVGRCVLEGEHLIDVYCDRIGDPETLIVREEALDDPRLQSLVARVAPRCTIAVPTSIFAEMASLPAAVGAVAVVPTPRPGPAPPADFCLLLEDLQDPGNVGSLLRSAAAAGVRQAWLSAHCAFAWSPKVLRAGQGAHFFVEIHEDVDLPSWSREFRSQGGTVVAAVASGGESLYQSPLVRPLALAIGNEGAGLSQALVAQASVCVTIPMPGGFESLNAAAAGAVALFECVRQTPVRTAARADVT